MQDFLGSDSSVLVSKRLILPKILLARVDLHESIGPMSVTIESFKSHGREEKRLMASSDIDISEVCAFRVANSMHPSSESYSAVEMD